MDRITLFLLLGFILSTGILFVITFPGKEVVPLSHLNNSFIGQRVTVHGNVTNGQFHKNGHYFFTFVDGNTSIRGIVWADTYELLQMRGISIEEGEQTLTGVIELYQGEKEFVVSGTQLELT